MQILAHTHTCSRTHTHANILSHTYTHIQTHTHMQTRMNICTHHTHTTIHTNAYTHTGKHTHTHANTGAHTHTQNTDNLTKLHTMYHWPHVQSRQWCGWCLDSSGRGCRAGARSGSCDTRGALDTASHPAPAPCGAYHSWRVHGLTCTQTLCPYRWLWFWRTPCRHRKTMVHCCHRSSAIDHRECLCNTNITASSQWEQYSKPQRKSL